MAVRTLILCNHLREGGNYAKRAGLKRFTYRVITRAGQTKGLPYSGLEVHVLPSFAEKRNRASILASIRYLRNATVSYVDPDDLPTLAEIAAEQQAEDLGPLTDDVLDAAYDEHAEFDHKAWEAADRHLRLMAMSDEEVAALLKRVEPEEAIKVVETVKAAKPPRKPRQPAAAPVADDFFAGAQ